jgi:hypothetical protein
VIGHHSRGSEGETKGRSEMTAVADIKADVDAFVREIENNSDVEALSNMSEALAREILVSDSTAKELRNKAAVLGSEAGALKSEAMIFEGAARTLKMKRKVVIKRLARLGA